MHDLIKDGDIIKSHDFGSDTPPTLAVNKGVWLPRQTNETPYDPATQTRELQVTSTATQSIHTYIVRDKTAVEIANDQAAKIAAVKTEAGRRIEAQFPAWKQRNMLAEHQQLLQIGEANWTPEQTTKAAEFAAGWAWAQSVRAASDQLEIDLPDDFADDSYWPVWGG